MGFINLGRLNIRKRNSCASALVSLSDVQPPSVYKSHILNAPINKLYLSQEVKSSKPFELGKDKAAKGKGPRHSCETRSPSFSFYVARLLLTRTGTDPLLHGPSMMADMQSNFYRLLRKHLVIGQPKYLLFNSSK